MFRYCVRGATYAAGNRPEWSFRFMDFRETIIFQLMKAQPPSSRNLNFLNKTSNNSQCRQAIILSISEAMLAPDHQYSIF